MTEDYIEREVVIHGKKVNARYSPSTGEFNFGKKSSLVGTDISETNVGAFRTMDELTKAFSNENLPLITYSSVGENLGRTITKDRLYSRTLGRLGYREKEQVLTVPYFDRVVDFVLKKLGVAVRETPPGFKYNSLVGTWEGPKRVWVRQNRDLFSKLPVITAVIGLVGGAFFLSSNVAGNVIGLSNTTSSWVGGVLILIGLIALGFWVKNRKDKKFVSKQVKKRKK